MKYGVWTWPKTLYYTVPKCSYLNMLLWSQLGPKSEWSDLRATATIEKSFIHTARDVAQQEARATPTHEACSDTTKLNQTKSTLFCHSMRDANFCLRQQHETKSFCHVTHDEKLCEIFTFYRKLHTNFVPKALLPPNVKGKKNVGTRLAQKKTGI